jgi:hypothetical protein
MKSYSLLVLLYCCPLLVYSQQRYDVVLTEIMADPSPMIGLPNYEWIELTNTSATTINLQQWRIADASSVSGPMPLFLLKPDSSVIVCSNSAFTALSAFGNCIAVSSFPSLDNDNDLLSLKTTSGLTMHAVHYHSSWYKNELKKEGGWSLEMIDPHNACNGFSNWKASIDPMGGTPGIINSVHAINNDNNPPQLQRAYTTGDSTIILVFDMPVDSSTAATLSNYSIDNGLPLVSATCLPPLFNTVQLKTGAAMATNTIYTTSTNHIHDCSNNVLLLSSVQTGLPSDPQVGEWIINEILFDPRPGGYDYVEFYNNSNKIFDASRLHIASRNTLGNIGLPRVLSATPYYILPGEWLVVTEDTISLARHYHLKDSTHILQLAAFPSYPDDEGNVTALNTQGLPTDEVSYSASWHFKLINDKEGISLERISPMGFSQHPGNWHSAASTAGYGTPGYKNSQYNQPLAGGATIAVSPRLFSPDNDGFNDIAAIVYTVDQPGYMINIGIYDAAGRMVRNLVRNAVLGITGNWNWDGLNDRGQKIPIGTYLVLAELYNLQGKKYIFKTAITLTRKFF